MTTFPAIPKISLVTAVYNQADTLEATLDSILGQRYPNLEYIVRDGGSTDGSVPILERYRKTFAHWTSGPDEGQYFALQSGFEASTGEVMGWINGDDVYFPWTLKLVGEIFVSFPQVDWIMGIPSVWQRDALRSMRPMRCVPRELIASGCYTGGDFGLLQQESTFWRRSLWEKAGALDTRYRLAGDFELWTRFARHAPLHLVDTVIGSFHYRGGENRSNLHSSDYQAEMAQVIRRLPPELKSQGKRFRREIARFQKAKPVIGLRGLVRRTSSAGKLTCPILSWDKDRQEFTLRKKSFLE